MSSVSRQRPAVLPVEHSKFIRIENRNRFGWYCDRLAYKTAVEIGVHLGTFSEILLRTSSLEILYGIDPYVPYLEMPFDRTEAERTAEKTLSPFGSRYLPVRLPSFDAAKVVPDPIDFVYIDGAHHAESVWLDLVTWWPKLRKGGTLAGHDYNIPSVRAMVDQFSSLYYQPLHIIPIGDAPSYYMVKR